MKYKRMPIEVESPEQLGYATIKNNLSESSYTDAFLRDIGDFMKDLPDLLLCYGSHAGHDELRELLAAGSAPGSLQEPTLQEITLIPEEPTLQKPALHQPTLREASLQDPALRGSPLHPSDSQRPALHQPTLHQPPLTKDDILLTVGAAAGLFIIATSLLEKGDELVVVRPNYATNIETPRAIGADIRFIDLRWEDGFRLDMAAVRAAVTPKTKYISVTHPHNPTGICLSAAQLKELIRVAEDNDTYLLVDETYREMVFGQQLSLAASYSDRVISVSSLSKAYGLPGIRTGWIITRNQQLMETFLAAKEQIHICGSVLDEEMAYRYMRHKDRYFTAIEKDIREKFGIVKEWMAAQDGFEWIEPEGGCVCFPRIKHPERVDLDRFYEILLKKYGTYTGPGHWFEMPRHYMRVGFGWPTKGELREGLAGLSKSLEEATLG